MSVPGARTLYEFFTRTHSASESIAGRMLCGCSTCAPKYASSVASWKDKKAIATVPSTSRGSALNTPSTSFHTYTSGNASAAPMTVAVRSEPPRPSVAIAPVFSPRPRKPVTTATFATDPPSVAFFPNARAFATFSYVTGRMSPFSNTSVVTKPSASNASYCVDLSPIDRRYEAKMRVDMRSPKLTSVARVRLVHSCMSATPVHTCSILFRSLETSARVSSSTPSSSMVSSWSLRMATTGSSLATSSASSHCMACSPAASRLLVVLPMALSTNTGISSGNASTMDATSRMRSASATDEPPNFITTLYASRASPGWTALAAGASSGAEGAAAAAARTTGASVPARCGKRRGARRASEAVAARATPLPRVIAGPRATARGIGCAVRAAISRPTANGRVRKGWGAGRAVRAYGAPQCARVGGGAIAKKGRAF